MIVIADTGPINYLIQIEQIDVLPRLYGRILVPPSVSAELQDPNAPERVRQWICGPPVWLEVRAPAYPPDAALMQSSPRCWRTRCDRAGAGIGRR